MPPFRQIVIGLLLLFVVIVVARFVNSGASFYDLEQHFDDVVNGPVLLFGLTLIFALYLLPVWVASTRNHRHFWTIAAINVLLGWTVLGWFGAVLWASTGDRHLDESNTGPSGALTRHRDVSAAS